MTPDEIQLFEKFKTELTDNLFHKVWKHFIDKGQVTSDISPASVILLEQTADIFARVLLIEHKLAPKPQQPKLVYRKAKVKFDDSEEVYDALIPNQRWNGWEMPMIHESGLDRLLEELQYTKVSNENNQLVVKWEDMDEEQDGIINRIVWEDGETYYDFGYIGLCFVVCIQPLYLVKDQSGRDYNGQSTLVEEVKDDEDLREWTETAQVGDEYTDTMNATKYTRIS